MVKAEAQKSQVSEQPRNLKIMSTQYKEIAKTSAASESLYAKASVYMKGGACAPGRIHGSIGRPLYLNRASGSRLYDVDGNEYIDFHNSAGGAFFGHNHPRLRSAVERSLDEGFFMNFDTPHHAELAELLCTSVPSAEQVRFSNTGTEATLGAIRLARGYTGRDLIVHFEGHFHGMHEGAFYNYGRIGKMDAHGEVETLPDSAGFTDAFKSQVIVVESNNINAFSQALKKYEGRIAAVIMEAISYNCGCMPSRKEYLQEVRRLCTEHEIVLIFDEVLSGFRMGLGGAQEYYGVIPDLTALAKALAGGFPLAAVVGRKTIMDALTPAGKVVMSGTYTAAVMPVLAAIECLKMLREKSFYDSINSLSYQFYDEFNALFKEFSIPGHIRGIGARFATYFGIEDEEDDYSFRKIAANFSSALYAAFVKKSLERGIYFHAGGWSAGGAAHPVHAGITAAHTSVDLDQALGIFKQIFSELAETV
jgi:glutamate-1-semialdehyde 2,1-aminomutase